MLESTLPPTDGGPLGKERWIPPSLLAAGGYYAFMWWGYQRPAAESDFYAMGKHGPVLYVCPSKRAVLLRHGTGDHHIWWAEVLHNLADRL